MSCWKETNLFKKKKSTFPSTNHQHCQCHGSVSCNSHEVTLMGTRVEWTGGVPDRHGHSILSWASCHSLVCARWAATDHKQRPLPSFLWTTVSTRKQKVSEIGLISTKIFTLFNSKTISFKIHQFLLRTLFSRERQAAAKTLPSWFHTVNTVAERTAAHWRSQTKLILSPPNEELGFHVLFFLAGITQVWFSFLEERWLPTWISWHDVEEVWTMMSCYQGAPRGRDRSIRPVGRSFFCSGGGCPVHWKEQGGHLGITPYSAATQHTCSCSLWWSWCSWLQSRRKPVCAQIRKDFAKSPCHCCMSPARLLSSTAGRQALYSS